MRELIQELVQTEAEARRMVEAARIEAERLVADAHKQVQALSARVRAESRVEAEKLIDAAVRQAQAEKSQRVLKAEAEIKQSVRLDVAIQEEIAEAVVRCICGDASLGPGKEFQDAPPCPAALS
jgi:vacuolar-type H+-ATPase subunit H